MARFEITAPDGNRYEITAPDDATDDQALEYAKANYTGAQTVAPEAPAAPQRTLGEQATRAVGRTVRAGVQNLAAIPEAITQGALSAYDLGAEGIEKLTGIPQTRYAERAGTVRGALTKLGLPEPENATERFAEDVAGGMAGAGGIVKAGAEMVKRGGTKLVQKLGEMLSTAPTTQVVAGGTGPGAASLVREEGGGPVAQTVAGVTAALAPSAPTLLAATTRAAVRGGEGGRQRVARNIETFEDAGAGTPSVGQATESRANRAVESVLAKTPGSAGRIAAKAEQEAAGLGTKVEDMATSLSGSTGAAPAGRRIKAGLEQFVDEFKGASGKLYDELDKHIPQTARVDVSNTRATLEKLNPDIPGAPSVGELFKNARIKGIEGALKSDTETAAGVHSALPAWQRQLLEQMPDVERTAVLNGLIDGKLPYEALKKLRTLVGNEISDSTIASDVPRSKWKPLYAALSKDMAAAAQQAGPKAEAAFVRANNHYSAGMKRLDDVLGPILKKGDPEDVFKAALSGTQEGATTINGVMKSLPVESRKAVAATMLQRLGKATPGKQDDIGEVFSSETFLTNWNRLHPDSKRVLFSTLPDEMRGDLDKIAKVASNVREGSKVFANPSGTGQVVAATSGLTAFGVLLATGQLGGAGALAVGAGAANVQARLMTNPKVVHWLAKTTAAPAEQLPAQLNQLFQQSLYMKGDERREVREFVKQAREAAATQ